MPTTKQRGYAVPYAWKCDMNPYDTPPGNIPPEPHQRHDPVDVIACACYAAFLGALTGTALFWVVVFTFVRRVVIEVR